MVMVVVVVVVMVMVVVVVVVMVMVVVVVVVVVLVMMMMTVCIDRQLVGVQHIVSQLSERVQGCSGVLEPSSWTSILSCWTFCFHCRFCRLGCFTW